MKTRPILLVALICILFSACKQETHFISDPTYRQMVEEQFAEQRDFAKARNQQLFEVFEQELSLEEEEALKFLYAFMPMCDLADYNGEYFLSMVRASLDAKTAMPWGKDIPEKIFRHFVLPYRVNNENLDTARLFIYRNLKDRVKSLSLEKAILEVNHWCHEHVTYKGADIRTSAPLATIRTGTGRCGEESTLLVAALRAVGIPARQVYTPRWAHSDDNHAWVEAWANGEWHFLGGCEPSPQLNQGWFAEPARRAMLVHTKAFGAYDGPEEIIHQKEQYSELNVLERYAETKTIHVSVIDQNKENIENAQVDFGLYNYAEFFPIASLQTNNRGRCHFTSGLGDLIIWASKEGRFSYHKISVEKIDTLVVNLSDNQVFDLTQNINLIPPKMKHPLAISGEGKVLCQIRLHQEDSMRMAYEQGFISQKETYLMATELGYDKTKVWNYIQKSRGNWQALVDYLKQAYHHPKTLTLLGTIAEKDLRDTPTKILLDHLTCFNGLENMDISDEMVNNYILSPRIKNEIIVAWRSHFLKEFGAEFIEQCKTDISVLSKWIDDNIELNKEKQYYDLPITPRGVYELKKANRESRNVFFVAVCRSFGIPSRLDPPTLIPQVFENDKWKDIFFKGEETPQRSVKISFRLPTNPGFEPEYYLHFTLARINEKGYKTLEFDYNQKWNNFPNPISLYPGKYVLTTGNRLESGSVLSTQTIFDFEPNSQHTVDIPIRSQNMEINEIAEYKLENIIAVSNNKEIELTSDNPFVAILFDPDKEPSKHVLVDMSARKTLLDALDTPIYYIIKKNGAKVLQDNMISNPKNVILCTDEGGNLDKLHFIFKDKNLKNDLPLVIIFTNREEIVFLSHGYQIGIPDQLIKYLNEL